MIPVVFINCRLFPFIAWIISGRKVYETRTRDMLRALVGQRVYLAETGRGGRPIIRCSCVIDHSLTCDLATFRALRHLHSVPTGSVYDWNAGTRKKVLYRLADVQPVDPFAAPEGPRHGRVWMEYTPEK